MSEEEYFTQHHNDNTDLLLLDYSERFETPYFNIEDTGINLSEAELRADLLHCLYAGAAPVNDCDLTHD